MTVPFTHTHTQSRPQTAYSYDCSIHTHTHAVTSTDCIFIPLSFFSLLIDSLQCASYKSEKHWKALRKLTPPKSMKRNSCIQKKILSDLCRTCYVHFRQTTTELSELQSDLKRQHGHPATSWLRSTDADVQSADIGKTHRLPWNKAGDCIFQHWIVNTALR